jgi:hypothetical protein
MLSLELSHGLNSLLARQASYSLTSTVGPPVGTMQEPLRIHAVHFALYTIEWRRAPRASRADDAVHAARLIRP